MPKHIEYHFELYENSFINDPVWSVQSQSPFPSISVGQRFDTRTLADLSWDTSPNANQEYRVKDVEHIFWEVNSHIGHKLMVKLEIIERTQEF
jgi:hypothetical protein